MKHTYFPSKKDDEKRQIACLKARARGIAAEEWFKTNKLTKYTQPEFNALMKKVDGEFEKTPPPEQQ